MTRELKREAVWLLGFHREDAKTRRISKSFYILSDRNSDPSHEPDLQREALTILARHASYWRLRTISTACETLAVPGGLRYCITSQEETVIRVRAKSALNGDYFIQVKPV